MEMLASLLISAVTNSSNSPLHRWHLSPCQQLHQGSECGRGGEVGLGHEARDTGIGQGPGSGWHSLKCVTQCQIPAPVVPLGSGMALKGCSQFNTFSSDLFSAWGPLTSTCSWATPDLRHVHRNWKETKAELWHQPLCLETPACFHFVMHPTPAPSVWLSLNISGGFSEFMLI